MASTPVTSTAWIWLTCRGWRPSWPAKLSSSSSRQGEPGQTRQVGNLVSGDLHDTKPSQASRHGCRLLTPASAGMLEPADRCATVLRVPSYLLRVQLEDRPGSLGSLAVALGSVGADILSLDVVERGDGLRDRRSGRRPAAGRDARHAHHRGREPQRGLGRQHPAAHRPARGPPGAGADRPHRRGTGREDREAAGARRRSAAGVARRLVHRRRG